MTKNSRGGMRAGCYFLEIGAANSAGVDLYQNFTGSDFGHGDSFEPHIIHAAIDGCPHGRWNFVCELGRGHLWGNGHIEKASFRWRGRQQPHNQFVGARASPPVLPGAIVLVRALSRSHAQRFSDAILLLRARRKTRAQSRGLTATWRAKRLV